MEITILIRLNGKQPLLSILSSHLSPLVDQAELYVFIRRYRHGSLHIFIVARVKYGVIEGTEHFPIKDRVTSSYYLSFKEKIRQGDNFAVLQEELFFVLSTAFFLYKASSFTNGWLGLKS